MGCLLLLYHVQYSTVVQITGGGGWWWCSWLEKPWVSKAALHPLQRKCMFVPNLRPGWTGGLNRD